MKKIIYIYLLMMLVSSCDVLDITPSDRIVEDVVWDNQALVELYVTTCYHGVEHGFFQGGPFGAGESGEIFNGENNIVPQGILTADNVTTANPSDNLLSLFGTPPGLNYWTNGYSYIRKINTFFEKIEAATLDADLKNRLKGEMKFMRAFIYSHLIWRYGGVPIFENTFQLNDNYFTNVSRASYDECVKFIVSDLDQAIGLLPNQQTGSNLGRASADAARALKSRVLLYAASPLNNQNHDQAKWQAASDAAATLLNARYSLFGNYQGLFLSANSGNSEIIFARYFSQANPNNNQLYGGRNGDHGWGYKWAPTQNMVDAYQMNTGELPYLESGEVNLVSGFDPQNPYVNRDPRFYASILYDGADWQGRATEIFSGGIDSPESSIEPWNAAKTGYNIKKFLDPNIKPTGSSINSTSPYIYFRYAEILLNYAEAQFELNHEDVARTYVNMVRSRPGVAMPLITASGDALRKKIQQERRVELAFEGHRYFDVRRWKIAPQTETEAIKGIRVVKKGDGSRTYNQITLLNRTFGDQLYLVPIPRSEVNKSQGSLKQNPGY